MAAPPNERDYELLNAYLDGELPAGDQAAFEQRLKLEPGLRAEYDSLRQTIALLGMSERLPVPRNFTLDPAVYGRPARTGLSLPRFAPLVAAGAAIAAVLVCAGIFILGGGLPGSAAPVAERAEYAAEPAEEAAAEEPAAEEEAMEAPAVGAPAEQPATELMQAAEAEAEQAEEVPQAEMAAEDEALPEEMPAGEEALPAEMPAEEEAMPEESPGIPTGVPSGPGEGVGGGGGGEPPTPYAEPTQPRPTSTVPQAPTEEEPRAQAQAGADTAQKAAGEAKAPPEQPGGKPRAIVTAAPHVEPQFPPRTIALIAGGVILTLAVILGVVILVRRRR